MNEKLQQYQRWLKAYITSLRDVRNLGLFVFTVIVLLISWSGIKAIQTNYGLQKQITELSQENQLATLENTNVALQNQYFTTDQYLEVTARQNFGLAAPGETEILVPRKVALAHTVKQSGDTAKSDQTPTKQPRWQRNFQSWMNFFLHR